MNFKDMMHKEIADRIDYLKESQRQEFLNYQTNIDRNNEMAAVSMNKAMLFDMEKKFLTDLIVKYLSSTTTVLCANCATVCVWDWKLEYEVCPKCGSDKTIKP